MLMPSPVPNRLAGLNREKVDGPSSTTKCQKIYGTERNSFEVYLDMICSIFRFSAGSTRRVSFNSLALLLFQ